MHTAAISPEVSATATHFPAQEMTIVVFRAASLDSLVPILFEKRDFKIGPLCNQLGPGQCPDRACLERWCRFYVFAHYFWCMYYKCAPTTFSPLHISFTTKCENSSLRLIMQHPARMVYALQSKQHACGCVLWCSCPKTSPVNSKQKCSHRIHQKHSMHNNL